MIKRIISVLFLCLLLHVVEAQGENAIFSPDLDGIYQYCPSGFMEDGIEHIYYCTNVKSNQIVDYIGYRTSVDGVHYSEENIVLENGRAWDAWDAIHTCDPDVIKGIFMLDGVEYNYLMVYLGCDTGNNQGNQIGLAVAQKPEGPFVKVETLNPFVAFERDLSKKAYWDIFQWGVGQASLISMDKAGKVMLIYTRGDLSGTYLVCEKWDLLNLNHPKPIGGDNWRTKITNRGVIGRDMRPATLLNADFVYDERCGTLYMVADGAPCYMEGVDAPGEPTFISSNLRILSYSQQQSVATMADFFVSEPSASWTTLSLIGTKDTGYPRNHNAGLLSDPYGWMVEPNTLHVLYSVSLTNEPSNSLWTYRIHKYDIPLEN